MKKKTIWFPKRNSVTITGILIVILICLTVVPQATAQEGEDPLEWVREISLEPSSGYTPLNINAEVVWNPDNPWKIFWEFGCEVEMAYTEVVNNVMLYKVDYVSSYLQNHSDPADYQYWPGVKVKYLNPGKYTITANITVFDDSEVYTKTISNVLTVKGDPVTPRTEDTDTSAGAAMILSFILRLLFW